MVLKRSSRTVVLSLVACLAFIAAAILAWDVPMADITNFLLLSFGLLVVLVISAALFIAVIKMLRRWLDR